MRKETQLKTRIMELACKGLSRKLTIDGAQIEYFQKSLPKHSLIDNKIKHILSQVKQKNINSIYQLRATLDPNHHHHNPTYTSPDQTLNTESPPKILFSRNFTSDKHNAPHQFADRHASLLKYKHYSTIDKPKQSLLRSVLHKNNPEDISFIHPVSKIKKHLIDSIDFRQIEKAMYHRTKKVNRFQFFYNNLKKKSSSLGNRTKTASKNSQAVRLIETEQAKRQLEQKECNSSFYLEDNNFRITQKRRFWIATREDKRVTSENQFLAVKGYSSGLE